MAGFPVQQSFVAEAPLFFAVIQTKWAVIGKGGNTGARNYPDPRLRPYRYPNSSVIYPGHGLL